MTLSTLLKNIPLQEEWLEILQTLSIFYWGSIGNFWSLKNCHLFASFFLDLFIYLFFWKELIHDYNQSVSMYSKPYIPILLTVCSNINIKNLNMSLLNCVGCVVTWVRGLRGSIFYVGCVGYVGQDIFYVGQYFTWVAWVKYIFAWVEKNLDWLSWYWLSIY